MPYDPKTGQYTPEDTNIEKRITGLLSKDSEFMQQAATQGKKAANRRGLLNSSMGVQAAESARISAALPIASQESAQAHDANQRGRGFQLQDVMQQRDIDATQQRLETDIGSRERMQERDIVAQQERLQSELGSREKLQAAELAAEKERLGQQLSHQEKLALQDLRAAEKRLGMEIGSRQQMQELDLASRERLAALDNETRERVAGLDREAQERIANMNVAASERQAASSLAAQFEASYANIVSNIMANPEIPAAERQRYLDHAARVRDSNLALVEQMYSVDLNWSSQTFTQRDTYRGNQDAAGRRGSMTR